MKAFFAGGFHMQYGRLQLVEWMTIKPVGQGLVSALLQQSTNSSKGNESSISNTLLDDKALLPKLEKHIDDYQKGKGYLSKGISKKIRAQAISSSSTLSEIDPSLSTLYNNYSTGLSYTSKARFTYGINKSVETSRKLLDLYS